MLQHEEEYLRPYRVAENTCDEEDEKYDDVEEEENGGNFHKAGKLEGELMNQNGNDSGAHCCEKPSPVTALRNGTYDGVKFRIR